MRSVVVVFPASMCAMMPMFRVFSSGTCRDISLSVLRCPFSVSEETEVPLATENGERITGKLFFVSRCSVRNRRTTAFLCYPVETELRENLMNYRLQPKNYHL